MKTYHIYGRTTYAEPLTLISSIRIDDNSPISQTILDQQAAIEWVELVAIPDDKIIWARSGEGQTQ